MLLWYWYEVGGRVTGSEFKVKLLEAWSAMQLKQVSSSLYVVTAEGRFSENELRDRLHRTVGQIGLL